MPTSASFVQHALDLVSGVGPVRSRAMFGGYGLSLNGISLGIIDDDRLYLRVDDLTREQFKTAGAQPFTYPSKKGPMVMNNYWSLPDEAIDDPDVAVRWAKLSVEASIRGDAAKKSKGKKSAAKKEAPGSTASKKAASAPAPARKKAAPKKPAPPKKAAKRPAAKKAKPAASAQRKK